MAERIISNDRDTVGDGDGFGGAGVFGDGDGVGGDPVFKFAVELFFQFFMACWTWGGCCFLLLLFGGGFWHRCSRGFAAAQKKCRKECRKKERKKKVFVLFHKTVLEGKNV